MYIRIFKFKVATDNKHTQQLNPTNPITTIV